MKISLDRLALLLLRHSRIDPSLHFGRLAGGKFRSVLGHGQYARQPCDGAIEFASLSTRFHLGIVGQFNAAAGVVGTMTALTFARHQRLDEGRVSHFGGVALAVTFVADVVLRTLLNPFFQ